MAIKWSDVIAKPEYQELTDEDKQKVKDRYYTNVVAKSEGFLSLPDLDKERVKTRFYGGAPAVSQPSSPSILSSLQSLNKNDVIESVKTGAKTAVKEGLGSVINPFGLNIPGLPKPEGTIRTAKETADVATKALAAPFEIAGEGVKVARGGGKFAAPSIVQKLAPKTKTKEEPSDILMESVRGLKGIGKVATTGDINKGKESVEEEPGIGAKVASFGLGMATMTPGSAYSRFPVLQKIMTSPLSKVVSGKAIQEGKIVKALSNVYKADKTLAPEGLALQEKGLAYAKENAPKLLAEYKQKFGNEVSTDKMRDLLKPVGYDGYNSKEFHEPASALKKVYESNLLREAKAAGKDKVLLMSGGSGSGKTSSLKTMNIEKEKLAAIMDSNLSNYESAVKQIDALKAKGFKVEVQYVFRHPDEAWFDGVLKRLTSGSDERIVPLDIHMNLHEGSLKTAIKLAEKYGDDINLYDNSLGKGNMQKISLEKMKEYMYTYSGGEDEIIRQTIQEAERGRLSPRALAAALGDRGISSGRGSILGTGSQGSPSPYRSEAPTTQKSLGQTPQTPPTGTVPFYTQKQQTPFNQSAELPTSPNRTPFAGGTGIPPTPPPPPGSGVPPMPGAGGPPKKDIFGVQLEKFNVSDDARKIFAETSEMMKPEIDAARRGKISWKETKVLADQLGMSEKQIVNFNRGKALNAEQIEATKGIVGASVERVQQSLKAYQTTPTQENLLKFSGEFYRHAGVQEKFIGARAEAGRALQIFRKITDPTNLAEANRQKMLDAIGGQRMTEEIAKRLAAIDPSDISSVNQFIRKTTRAKTTDQIFEFWMNSILSSPLTHKANTIGNTLFTLSKIPERALAASIDSVASLATGQRTVYFREVPAEAFGFLQGLKDGVRRGLYALKTGETMQASSKMEIGRIPAIKGTLGEVVRIPGKLLTAEDEFAKSIIGRMELNAQAYRQAIKEGLKGKQLAERVAKLITEPTPQIMKAVEAEEIMRTFQNPSGPAVGSLMSLRRNTPGLKYILPFIQTPANITARALERSPLGWFKVLNTVAKGAGQEAIVKDMSNAVMGSGIAASVAYYTLEGKITGDAPKEKAERDRFFREGKQPYSIKVKDKWYSYARLEPLSMILGMTAQAVDSAKQEKKDLNPNMVKAIVTAIPKNLLSKTFLSGISSVIDAIEDPERYGASWVTRMSGSAVPFSGFSRFIAQQMDNVIRKPTTFKESILANIPGQSKKVPPRLNVYGEPATRPNDLISTLTVPRTTEKQGPLEKEDVEIEREQGFPGKIMGGMKLDDKEYDKYVKTSGQYIKTARTRLQALPEWQNAQPDQKRLALNKIEDAARQKARKDIFVRVLKRIPRGKVEERQKFMKYGAKNLGVFPGKDY